MDTKIPTSLLDFCTSTNKVLKATGDSPKMPLDIRVAAIKAHADMLGFEIKIRQALLLQSQSI